MVRPLPSGRELSLCVVAESNPWVCGPERQRDGDAERRRGRETERRRLGRKKIFFENNFDFSEIRVIFVRS